MPRFNGKRLTEGAHTARASGRVLAVLFLLASFSATSPLRSEAQVVSARAGVVCHVAGDVSYHPHSKDGSVQKLEVGMELNNGDLVLTGDNAIAEWSLNPNSYLTVNANSHVRLQETSLDRMRFDIERGDMVINMRSLSSGVSLALHAPPGLLSVHKPGRYIIRIAESGETEAIVVKGELRYKDKNGRLNSVKAGRQVNFYRGEKIDNGVQQRPYSGQSK
jgi:FecR-like protein